ncbi:MAG: HNH endonuclease [Myxococcales bacterium]|nr:HNH endonuclease [Myxococcales bacterium]
MDTDVVIEGAPSAVPTWTRDVAAQVQPGAHPQNRLDWQAVDRALRSIARRRAGLDAEEARWLREAEVLKIWEPLGMVSALDYVERVLGYAPRTARERLRVARALGGLPKLTEALASGALAYSAVRELTRVATATTEEAWVACSLGKSLREIEGLVADHRLGDRPDDPKDPTARMHVVRLELSAETFALLRQARQVLDDEHGTRLSEDQLVAQLCGAVLDGAGPAGSTGRAKFQVAVTVCERCQQGWQHGAGAKIPIGPAAVERVMCDAQHLGSIDGDAPARAYQDIAPSVARFVWHRDAGRCRVPGCRSSRNLEIHHLVHRADGGGHEANNLVLACSSCHQSHHAGTLRITGTADHIEVVRPAQPRSLAPVAQLANTGAHVGMRDGDETAMRGADERHDSVARVADARRDPLAETPGRTAVPSSSTMDDFAALCGDAATALTQLGWRPAIAQAAVRDAACTLGPEATLERVLVEALRRCPLPPGTTSVADHRRDQGT